MDLGSGGHDSYSVRLLDSQGAEITFFPELPGPANILQPFQFALPTQQHFLKRKTWFVFFLFPLHT